MTRITRSLAASAALMVAIIGLSAGSLPLSSARPAPSDRPEKIVADYNREIRESQPRADGVRHVDTPALIAKLEEAHVTDYFYLVWHESTDWEDLKEEFLPAAEQAGIDVWVYLVPPSECNPERLCSFPYMTDYVTWAEEIAELSLEFDNLEGWAMDDFQGTGNLAKFTPEYVAEMTHAGEAINPELEFLPVLYHDDYSTEFLRDYGPHFDGAIFPYTLNYRDTDGLGEQLDRISGQLEPYGIEPVLMVYATKISTGQYPPSADYVESALRLGLEYMMRDEIRGVVTYAMAKEFEEEPCGFEHHLDLTMPDYTRTVPTDFVSASQTVQLDPNAERYQLALWEQDSYPVATIGYHFKQVLVDGQLVWEQDVGADPAVMWTERALDLTPYVAGKSEATITLRLYDKKGVSNFGIRVSYANLQSSGFTLLNPDFSEQTGWDFAGQGPGSAVIAFEECDPQRQLHLFEGVRDLYGPYALYVRAEAVDSAVRPSLVDKAEQVLAYYRKHEYVPAAEVAHALALEARAVGLPVLAAQSEAVTQDLRRQGGGASG